MNAKSSKVTNPSEDVTGDSARARILAFFKENLGKVVHTRDIARVARIHDYQRRIRELRHAGWPIMSDKDSADLKPGEYLMESDVQLPPEHEHAIPAAVRREVLIRDGSTCQMCGSTQGDPHPTIQGRKLTLQVDHVDPDGPATPENLRVLCSACHEGRSNLERPPQEVLNVLAAIRRAPRHVQEKVYLFLHRKFGRPPPAQP